MHLIDQIDLEATVAGHVLRAILQVVHILDPALGCPIHLNEINKAPFGNRHTGSAFATGCGTHPLLAVQAPRQYSRNGGFADATRAGEQIGVMQTIVIKGVRQRLHHMVLANQSGEINRAQLACENLIRHNALL